MYIRGQSLDQSIIGQTRVILVIRVREREREREQKKTTLSTSGIYLFTNDKYYFPFKDAKHQEFMDKTADRIKTEVCTSPEIFTISVF